MITRPNGFIRHIQDQVETSVTARYTAQTSLRTKGYDELKHLSAKRQHPPGLCSHKRLALSLLYHHKPKLHQKLSNNITKRIQNEYIQDARCKEIPNHLKVNLQTLHIAYSINP